MGNNKKLFGISSLNELILIIPGYLFFLSYLHIQVYYGWMFDIPIFKYLTVNSFLLQSVSYIGTAFIPLILLFILRLAFIEKEKVIAVVKAKGDSINTYAFYTFLILFIIQAVLFYLRGYKNVLRTISVNGLLYWVLWVCLTNAYKKIEYFSPNEILLGLISLVIIPVSIVLSSYNDAIELQDDLSYPYIVNLNLKEENESDTLKVIGKVDQYFFLQPAGNDSLFMIRKYDDFKSLNIKQYEKGF